jgi:dephospho-CoA kinase
MSRRKRRRQPTADAEAQRGVQPRCIAVTGGIGSGKSTALEVFRRLGAAVQSSDEVVHEVLSQPDVTDQVRRRFGDGVLDASGAVDRAALGAAAFADDGGIAFLESLIHPRVGAARRAWEDAERRRTPPPPLLVCEVPLLFEAGLADQFDAVLVITAPEAIRRERVESRGQGFSARSGRQIPEEEKIRRADRYLVNDGSVADLEAWTAERFEEYSR